MEYKLELNTPAMAKAKTNKQTNKGVMRVRLNSWFRGLWCTENELNEINSLTLKQEKKMLIL